MEWFCRVTENYCSFHTVIDIGYKKDGKIYHLENDTFKEVGEFDEIGKHSLRIPGHGCIKREEIGTVLLDGLLRSGFKPTNPPKNTQELDAVKYHLEDMRKLVFDKKEQ